MIWSENWETTNASAPEISFCFSPHLFNIDGSRDIFVVAFGCAVSVGSDLGLSHFVMVGLWRCYGEAAPVLLRINADTNWLQLILTSLGNGAPSPVALQPACPPAHTAENWK